MIFKVQRKTQSQLLEDSEKGRALRQSARRTLRLAVVLLTLGYWCAVPLSWVVDGFRADGIPILFAPLSFWWIASLFDKGLDECIGKDKWKGRWPFAGYKKHL